MFVGNCKEYNSILTSSASFIDINSPNKWTCVSRGSYRSWMSVWWAFTRRGLVEVRQMSSCEDVGRRGPARPNSPRSPYRYHLINPYHWPIAKPIAQHSFHTRANISERMWIYWVLIMYDYTLCKLLVFSVIIIYTCGQGEWVLDKFSLCLLWKRLDNR